MVALVLLPVWALDCILNGLQGKVCANIEIVPGQGRGLSMSNNEPHFDRDSQVQVEVKLPKPGQTKPYLIVSPVPEENHPWRTFLLLAGFLMGAGLLGWMLSRRRETRE